MEVKIRNFFSPSPVPDIHVSCFNDPSPSPKNRWIDYLHFTVVKGEVQKGT
jgi:hypothetical protein